MSANQRPRRVVVSAERPKTIRGAPHRHQPREGVLALAIIAAAALATFAALLITSRPYDPMNSTIGPQEVVPPAPIALTPSPKASPPTTASPIEAQRPSPEVAAQATERTDAELKNDIEQIFASDMALANADVNVIVENGRVTLSGTVDSAEVKQKAERSIRSVRGVIAINDQLAIVQSSPD